jgi:hypothetical protein
VLCRRVFINEDKGDSVKTICNYVYAAMLAVTALNFAPTLASAQESAKGKFTLTHQAHLGNATLAAGDYAFSFDPDNGSRMLNLSKLSGARTGYMVMVTDTEDSKPSDQSRLILEATTDGSYVSAMQLPEFGMTLHFTVPLHTEREIAKAATAAAALGQ